MHIILQKKAVRIISNKNRNIYSLFTLTGQPETNWLVDSFIKEPSTQAPTAWHHDLPFWPFDGNHIASVWIACTPVSTETSGLVYVAGSHKWKKMYRPVPAVPIEDFMSEEVKKFEECPMFHKEFNNPEYKFLSWEM